MTDRIREIMSWYASDNPGTRANIYRLLMTGRLAGTGRLVILPVDQGFEHGPARSFAPNPDAYDPRYHFELAIEAGLNAYAAPLGPMEAAAASYAGCIPTILKVNSSNSVTAFRPRTTIRQETLESATAITASAPRSARPENRSIIKSTIAKTNIRIIFARASSVWIGESTGTY